ncbi:MAG: tRNA (N6-isopentenyl adenosine(37)-C2)-methylthiotransferase MiaB [Verrucomicrobiota bacterium]|nr:tRNA (N6-isopentenyl adenosine(37)-C2)-methylthiotransferase MiaB [Verrucomicrobiota bacterium]
MKRVFIKTYGCQMNERDSELVAHDLVQNGYELVNNESVADIVLLNTCSVREQAEKKAIGKANNLLSKRKKNHQVTLGILGCMAQNRGSDLLKEVQGVNLIVGTQKFHRVLEYVNEISTRNSSGDFSSVIDLEEEEGSQHKINQHVSSDLNRVSAFVSIMQGCNMNCSFCIVPKTRGTERYRDMEEICDEIKILRDRGVREVTLLGQIVNAYGRGVFLRVGGKSPFVQLLNKIHEIEGIERIRFTSPHPTSFGPDLIEAYGVLPKICDYAHLPMQSGSNRMLKSMNRPYSREKFLQLVSSLRSVNQNMRISTDVIVGYPGETEAEFEHTISAFKEAAFEMAFIFKYSERSGTPAAQFPDKIPQEIKEERNQKLLALLARQSEESNLKIIKKTMEVLVESQARKGRGDLMGRTRCYRKVIFEAGRDLIGQMVPVQINEASSTILKGSLV